MKKRHGCPGQVLKQQISDAAETVVVEEEDLRRQAAEAQRLARVEAADVDRWLLVEAGQW